MPKWAWRWLPSLLKSDLTIDTGDDDDLRWNDAEPHDDVGHGCGLDWIAGTNNTRDLRTHKVSQVMSGPCGVYGQTSGRAQLFGHCEGPVAPTEYSIDALVIGNYR